MEVLSFACGLTDNPPEILHLVFDRIAKFFIEGKRALERERALLTKLIGIIRSKLRESKSTLDISWNGILTRRKEMEDIRERTSTLHNSDWFVCQEHTTDFVPSRVYAIRIEKHSSPYPAAYVFQDPDYLNDGGPLKYIVFAPDPSSISDLVGFIRKLCAHFDIKITGVYNERLLLRANKGCASNDQFSVLEGELLLDLYSSNYISPLSIIEVIQQYTGQSVELREITIHSHECPEQITKTVRLRPNVKLLVVDTGVPSAVIQHLARELYGCDEMRSPSSEIQPDLTIKESYLEILEIMDHFPTTKLSVNDFNCLFRPARLTHLREMKIPSYYLDNFLGSLDRDNLSLEKFTLHTVAIRKLQNIEHTAFEVAEPMGESPISEEEEPTGLGGADFRKTRGKLVNLRLLTVVHVLPKSLEHLLDSRSPSLKGLELHFNYLSESDRERVSRILAKASLHLEELSMLGDFSAGNLGNIFGSIHKKRATFYCLRHLRLVKTSLESEVIETLAEAVQCGTFPVLCRLTCRSLVLSLNDNKLAYERLVSSCVNYYKESTITIVCGIISDELKHKLSRICYNSNVCIEHFN